MDSSNTEYCMIPERCLKDQSGHTLLLGYHAESGYPHVLRVGPSHGYTRPLPPSQFISISPLEYNKAQHDLICGFVWPRFAKKNKRGLWQAQLRSVETKTVTAAYEHQRKLLPSSLDLTLHALIQSNDWKLFSVRRTWSRVRWVSMVWTYWKHDSSRLLDLTLTEFEITHPEDRSKSSRLNPLQTTRYIVKEYKSLGPSRPRPSGDLPVPVTEDVVGKDAIGEKITQYIRARSSEASPLVVFLYDVFWAKNCFPKGSFPNVEEGINSLLYDPPKRYDLSFESAGGTGWHRPPLEGGTNANHSRDSPPQSTSAQGQKSRRGEGKVYLLDLKPAIESVSRYQDSRRDLYSAAQKFGIQVNEEEKNPVFDSLLIVRLWALVFSGSPKKIREEELERARKSASGNSAFKNEHNNVGDEGAPPIRPDDEDVDPNEVSSVPSNVTSGPSAFGKSRVDPEVDWENAFDEDEEDDY